MSVRIQLGGSCLRCGGSGYVPTSRANGVCFWCQGKGSMDSQDVEFIVRWHRRKGLKYEVVQPTPQKTAKPYKGTVYVQVNLENDTVLAREAKGKYSAPKAGHTLESIIEWAELAGLKLVNVSHRGLKVTLTLSSERESIGPLDMDEIRRSLGFIHFAITGKGLHEARS